MFKEYPSQMGNILTIDSIELSSPFVLTTYNYRYIVMYDYDK